MARTNFNIEQNLQNILDLHNVAPPEAGLTSHKGLPTRFSEDDNILAEQKGNDGSYGKKLGQN
jgi:hypothetical protein